MELEKLVEWERRLSEICRVNPYSTSVFERELRRLSRDLQQGAGKNTHTLTEDRMQLAHYWMHHFATTARQTPLLWQSIYFGLARFVLDPQLETPLLTERKLPMIWQQLDDLGKALDVPHWRQLLGIAERARRATRALELLRGHSARSRLLKQQIWTACFGADLVRLLVYESLLQEHNVLILGPTGSGKELVAQVFLAAAVGHWDEQSGKLQWVPHRTEALNLAEFPRDLMGAQIVGYKRGSYTGAGQDFQGVLARCDRGVVLLDEIGELPVEGQVVLLRALETKNVRPLGATTTEAADCRVIAATHMDLEKPIASPDFRRDLFYRLAGSIIRVPSLAERREELLPIALGFLDSWGVKEQASLYLEDPRHRLTQWLEQPEVQEYDWPGNVRELKRVAAQVLLGGPLASQMHSADVDDQIVQIDMPSVSYSLGPGPELGSGLPPEIHAGTWSMDELRHWYIHHVLALSDGHQKEAAQRLQIHRTTIYHAIKKEKTESSS